MFNIIEISVSFNLAKQQRPTVTCKVHASRGTGRCAVSASQVVENTSGHTPKYICPPPGGKFLNVPRTQAHTGAPKSLSPYIGARRKPQKNRKKRE